MLKKGVLFLFLILGVNYTSADSTIKINIGFQQPSYILEKENKDLFLEKEIILNCDREKDDCKINLDYRNSFGEFFKEKNFECITDFSFGITGEENKCNPNVVSIPLGEHQINIKLSEKKDAYHFDEILIKIINEGKRIKISNTNNIKKETKNVIGNKSNLILIENIKVDNNETDITLYQKSDKQSLNFEVKKVFGKCLLLLIIFFNSSVLLFVLKNTKIGKQYSLPDDCDI